MHDADHSSNDSRGRVASNQTNAILRLLIPLLRYCPSALSPSLHLTYLQSWISLGRGGSSSWWVLFMCGVKAQLTHNNPVEDKLKWYLIINQVT